MASRRNGREQALRLLYLADISGRSVDDLFKRIGDVELDSKTRRFMSRLLRGTLDNRKAIDELILRVCKNWELRRMAAIDRNILRLGAYEILHEDDTPGSVVIDEAVEMAKRYSTDDSGKFVNGVLDKIFHEKKPAS